MSETVKKLLDETRFVSIARGISPELLGRCAQGIYEGGGRLLEVTFLQREQDPLQSYRASIKAIRDVVGEALALGAGTVMTVEQVRAAYEMGAQYILSPNINRHVIAETIRLGMASIPGAATPTEVAYAWELGATVVKLFPAGDLGYSYIRNLRMPIDHIPLLASGGVNPETIIKFREVGIEYFGSGSTVFPAGAVQAGDCEAIAKLVAAHIQAATQPLPA